MKLSLERTAYLDSGTFGRFSMPDGMTLFTVERPWLNNYPNVSCIPCGEYICKPRRYNRGGYEAVEVVNVPDRSYILFHRGNFVYNSEGCILINSRIGGYEHGLRGFDSRLAFECFMKIYGDGFDLSITNYQGGILR